MTTATRIRTTLDTFPGSVTALAQGLGVSRSLLYAWCNGERVATEEDAERVVTLARRLTEAALDDVAARITPSLHSFWTLVDWRRVSNGVEVTVDLPEKARLWVERGALYACVVSGDVERDPEDRKVITRVTSSVKIEIQTHPPIGTQGPMRIVEETSC